jgi:hypothetical protein
MTGRGHPPAIAFLAVNVAVHVAPFSMPASQPRVYHGLLDTQRFVAPPEAPCISDKFCIFINCFRLFYKTVSSFMTMPHDGCACASVAAPARA